ncbi:ATP-grasp domain-containing protein [Parafrankia irregularis]|uniref:ATP-grasp domain-containing protein n=1 Tax=Parafrankia irregularis TaxID=795642 RepID=A0A0S4QVM4_9ACTN|nr:MULTISPECIES: ATP-grasp domain-containing protein [Parafrankia]MBE3205795.1 ATP-grasp domain-containing protein [Parafrankia sp. CH37]CUU59669.1 ATP-grasp domain-containing protein [Parafrankia irregularis]
MAGNSAFLILAHQLKTMVPPLAEALRQRGITPYVLSSRPAQDAGTPEWRSQVAGLHVTDGHAVRQADVDAELARLSAAGVRLLGCITVWDAYRELMAYANRSLGVGDLTEQTVRGLRDKLTMREQLREHGLSQVAAWPFDDERYAALADPSRYFVKPRTGFASLGAQRADRLTGAAELERLWERAASDVAYAGAFEGTPSFLIEEFIDGVECSFEVSVERGSATVHAVHEKVDLRESGRTVLENACACPPVSLDAAVVAHGVDHIALALKALGVDTGVHHVEARYTSRGTWEIVEVNLRIGGAYIVPSTRLHSGVDLMGRWIDLLLGDADQRTADQRPADQAPIDQAPVDQPPVDEPGERAGDGVRRTFFRVFFGEPGRHVARLSRRPGRIEVLEDKVFVHEGDTLPHVDREIFVGQALWDITALGPDLPADFVAETESYLEIGYRP